jgi:hypothetical protein
MRPAENIEHSIPDAREIIFLYAPYDNFEHRTLEAYGKIQQLFEEHRINGHFRILCSRDKKIFAKLQKICNDEPDIPVTIPFYYDAFLEGNPQAVITAAARESYHFRDLFAQKSPLQNNTYFFGRAKFLNALRDRTSRGENSGIFGLRKSGKTSVLLALSRLLETDGHRVILLDCQSPTITAGAWNDVLRLVALNLRKSAGLSTTDAAIGDFSDRRAVESFEKAVNDVYSRGKKLSVIAFDEIEHISPLTGVPRWRDGENARFLWQAIRSTQQKVKDRIAFIIAGTNPQITEVRKIADTDNPLLEYIHCEYLGGLTDKEMQSMCETLGDLMGMNFAIPALSRLYRSLGGHPYLTRQLCSHIHTHLPYSDRPKTISADEVDRAVRTMDFSPLIEDILSSLRERYTDEYTCLSWIALDDQDQVQYFLDNDPLFLRHLEGYGIVDISGGRALSRMNVVIDFLKKKALHSELIKEDVDRWSTISTKRGMVEVGLRSLLRNRLIDLHGKAGAIDALISTLSKGRAETLNTLTLDEIFSKDNCPLYWTDLISAMRADSKYWHGRLEMDESILFPRMNIINKYRADAHAKTISDLDFDILIGALDAIAESI